MSDAPHIRQGIRDLPEILYQLGTEKVILCPGSRNAPLLLSFTKFARLQCLSVVDERSAAYFALGIAQFTHKPVALVCTSGTAVLNFAPAIAEAYYQNIPLIVITADRPKEWIDQADGQTIRQQNIFANYVKAFFEVPGNIYTEDDLWLANRSASQAVSIATSYPMGPVHLNIPLREPLYTTLPEQFSGRYLLSTGKPDLKLNNSDIEFILNEWNKFEKKWIIIGVSSPNPELNDIIKQLSLRSDVVIIAENISNITGERIIQNPESWIASLSDSEKISNSPDLLITYNHSLVSKRLKQYLRKYAPTEHWQVSNSPGAIDTFQSLNRVYVTDAIPFFSLLTNCTETHKDFVGNIHQQFSNLSALQTKFLADAPFSDLKVMGQIIQTIPENSIVHVANSAPIRYSQLFNNKNNITWYSNRGTSGIDGCTSTAVGSAFASKRSTILISGDLAFLYDSNGLWNNYIPDNFKVIVINNNGGNIFSLIETSPEIDSIIPFITTPHSVKINSLAEAFGFHFFRITEKDISEKVFNDFFSMNKPSILEVVTDPEVNALVFNDFYKNISPKNH